MKVTKTHWITAFEDYVSGKYDFCLYPFEMTGDRYQTVGTIEVEFEVPNSFDPRQGQIAMLEEKRKKAMADYQMLMSSIDGKIASLRAIEHKEAV